MIAQRLRQIHEEIPPQVTLIAVSKFQPVAFLKEAYLAGQRDFGENRPQEMVQKMPLMPPDVRWHFIGHLQTNKVRFVVGNAVLIHSVDSLSLLTAIQNQAEKLGIIQDVLLQVHIALEDTKQGFEPVNLALVPAFLPNVRICGLMGMATLTSQTERVRTEFRSLRILFEQLKRGRYEGKEHFAHCSMGMSSDYRLAIEEGSTMVRIGSAIFPPRPGK